VEAHSAIPQPQQIPADPALTIEPREQARIVKRCIAKSPAQDHTERAIKEQVVRMALRHWRAGLLQHLRQVPIGKQHAQQVGERIEFKLEPSDLEQIWPEAEIFPKDRIGCAA